jgi:hypothetical protein
VEHLTQPGDVVGERGQRDMGRPYLESVRLEALDHSAPAGHVGPGAMDENDVHRAGHVVPHSLLELRTWGSVVSPDPARIARSRDFKATPKSCGMLARSCDDGPGAQAPELTVVLDAPEQLSEGRGAMIVGDDGPGS